MAQSSSDASLQVNGDLKNSHVSSIDIPAPSPATSLPASPIPIFTTVKEYRVWRRAMMMQGKSVGFVPTMGALHEGHLSLVRRSLAENERTVVSIFVNPAQFAPHEDLGTYPRTLESDLRLLEREGVPPSRGEAARTPPDSKIEEGQASDAERRTVSAVFLPGVAEMYPDGITQDVSAQKGTFVQVKGYDHQMEGTSRPTFFRGVATVVTKLFNIIQPDNAYFGQKDIQQALLLRRLVRDLLLSHPEPQNVHIVPTARDPTTHLALSSRNAYLTPEGLVRAPTLYKALRQVEGMWKEGRCKRDCVDAGRRIVVGLASSLQEGEGEGNDEAEVKLDYIEMNDAGTFDIIPDDAVRGDTSKEEGVVIVSGAMWVGKTRLIDNLLLGDLSDGQGRETKAILF